MMTEIFITPLPLVMRVWKWENSVGLHIN